ncbi:MAG: RNA polymerase sigma factor [Vicinamibacterales bacterium]
MDELASLYARHHADVRRFALFLTGDPAQADDLTSETFIRAWAARDRVAASSVRAYLMTITRNLWRDHHRRHRRLLPLDAATGEAVARGPEAEAGWRLREVRQALAAAAPADRRALLLHAEGWSYLDIAARLGISLGAVKSRIHRARAVLGRLSPSFRSGDP